jgi:signal transduction histidine kinase/class 3 adenylate cyclase
MQSCVLNEQKKPPKAINGEIDLQGWSFEKDGALDLSGEWTFVNEKLLDLKDLLSDKVKKFNIVVPKSWDGQEIESNGLHIKARTYGTYFLKIKNIKLDTKKTILLNTKHIITSSRIYFVNGKNVEKLLKGKIKLDNFQIAQTGVVGENEDETIPQYLKISEQLKTVDSTNYLIIHASNFTEIVGGLVMPLRMGLKTEIVKDAAYKRMLNSMVIGILLIMGLYHIGLFQQRREDKPSLYFGLFCFLICSRMIMTNGYLDELFSTPSKVKHEIFLKFVFLPIYLSVPLFYSFISRMFTRIFSKRVEKFLWYFSLIFVGITLIFLVPVYSSLHKFYLFVLMMFSVYIIVGLVRAYVQKRYCANIAFYGVAVLIVAVFNDVFVALKIISNIFLTPYGLVVFILSQSLMISKLFAKAYIDLERTTKQKVSLEELDRQKTRFFQNVSHEVRTPLTIIINTIEELRKHLKDDKILTAALRNSKRLYRLINQLLDFQKTKNMKSDPNLSVVNIRDFLVMCAENFQITCKAKKVNFISNLEMHNDVFVQADIDYLEKIVFNYLTNALKYTSEEGKVLLSVAESDDDVKISVTDTGAGIPKEKIDKLFKVFSQVDDSAIKDYEGTGLGLALVKELTEKLNGSVGVDSTINVGSEFWATIPIYQKSRRKYDVLILEDNQIFIESINIIFSTRMNNLKYSIVSSEAEAREFFERKDIKCFITNPEICNESTIPFIKFVNNSYKKTKVVFFDENIDKQLLIKATNELKIDHILSKPIVEDEFSSLVNQLVGEYDQSVKQKIYDILYVDDEVNLLNEFEKLLFENAPNMNLIVATSVEQAKEILNRYKVKVVLSDWNLGTDNGIDFLRYVKENITLTYRVLLTGSDIQSVPKNVVSENIAHGILDKPFGDICLDSLSDFVRKSEIKEQTELDISKYKPKDWHTAELETDESEKDIVYEEGDLETVLVVDDVFDMRNLISKVLHAKGYTVYTAKNGKDGLEKAVDHKPDLMIIDWIMPVMSGVELIEELKSSNETASIPTILLTAKSDDESKLIGKKMGASAYLGKPFNEIELLSVAENLLRLKNKEKEITELNREISENLLNRFLPPQIVDDIMKSGAKIDESHKLNNITVLFCDLCKFTENSFTLGPRKIATVLNDFLRMINDSIFEFDGTIDKIVGDSVMAMWGAPIKSTAGEQVEKAILCSQKIQANIEVLNKKWAAENLPNFDLRIGLHHGPAIVGYFGSEKRTDYTAVGHTINFAQRIENNAVPQNVYFSGVVRDLLPEDVSWEKVGNFNLKGISESVTLYKLSR